MARKMARDFTAYQQDPSAAEEKKLYTYHPPRKNGTPGRARHVPLDFREITAVKVSPEVSREASLKVNEGRDATQPAQREHASGKCRSREGMSRP